ncbi:hypothetical protein ACNQVK_00015 [Mycobacterium sp. 134]|uniref:hypothetical protein n=1 Tax=Mycobacterium sp. 134 TaxID=3400425 RepID=UPI003AB08E92
MVSTPTRIARRWQVERELKSMVLGNLKRLRGAILSVDRVAYFPDSVQQFIKR